ncbi:MAG TPA: protein kinase [Euzebyales bacterium]|nr:protein kinase [Euzebyales bacterium]
MGRSATTVSGLPQPGDTWNGRYEITAELGRGGFGRVYRAWDPLLERDVAIKMLRPSDDFTPTDHQRFRRETNIAASLEHRNIVTVYDGGERNGLLYLVMRFVAGRDLRYELAHGPLDEHRAVSVVRQVGAALDYAHAKGLVHRDVKPGNILCLDDSDAVYLADFGISRRVDQTTDNPVTQGLAPATLAYAAPEQMRTSARVDGRTDVYALGCVLFECLTGRKPFEGEIAEMITAHLHEAPPRASAVRPGLSRTWDRVIATAMAKDPSDRFRRCATLAAAAELVLPPPEPPSEPMTATMQMRAGVAAARDEPGTRSGPGDTRRLDRGTTATERALRSAVDAARRAVGDVNGTAARTGGAASPPTGAPATGRPASPGTGSGGTDRPAEPATDRPAEPATEWPARSTTDRAAPPATGSRAADQVATAAAEHASAPAADRAAPPRRITATTAPVDAPTATGPGGGDTAAEPAGAASPPAAPRRRSLPRPAILAVVGLPVAVLMISLAWPLVGSGQDPGDPGPEIAGYADPDAAPALDDAQLDLLNAAGVFEKADCRPPNRDPLAGEQVAIACTGADEAPTRVVFRQFASVDERDAAFASLASATSDGECRDDRRATHGYEGARGPGQVVCAVDSSKAGLSWTVPGAPIMGSARLDEPAAAGELYDWWADHVERTDG